MATSNHPNGDRFDLRNTRRQRVPLADPAKMDRLPPHSHENEQGVLGCILSDPTCIGLCIEKFKKGAEVFFDLRHRTLYELFVEMYDQQRAIDLLTVQQLLKDRNQLEGVGGIAYLASLPDTVPSAANLTFYVEIVQEKHLLRQIIQICTTTVGRLYDNEGNVDELVDEVEGDILKVCEGRVDIENRPVRDLVIEALSTIERWHEQQGALTGIGTGFADFDRLTNGLQNGEMIVIAGRPGVGKSAWSMNVAEHVAVELRLPVGVFSLEMTAESLVMRAICSRARVNIRSIRDGFLAERDFPRLTKAAGKLMNAPLHIDDSAGLSIMQLRAKARRVTQQHGLKLLIVDYLQLLNSTNRKADNRQQEVSDIARGLKALAKELQIPVIVLAQLNRKIEERGAGGRPKLSDLRESGEIEATADVVGLLYNPDKKEIYEDAAPVNLLVAKNRNGPTQDVEFTFLRCLTRFESASRIGVDDVPHDNPQATLPYHE